MHCADVGGPCRPAKTAACATGVPAPKAVSPAAPSSAQAAAAAFATRRCFIDIQVSIIPFAAFVAGVWTVIAMPVSFRGLLRCRVSMVRTRGWSGST